MKVRVALPGDGPVTTVLAPGTLLRERYSLQFLARGGMGCAYRGVCGQRSYFVKEAPAPAEHLQSEARLLRRLPLGGFPRVLECFQEDGFGYLVCEFIEGLNLEQEAARSPWQTPAEADLRQLALELCRLLETLHALKPPILYLDLKPANVIRASSGKLFLVDFGISQSTPSGVIQGARQGSPQTASPEHFTGPLDARSDLYTLAATVQYLARRELSGPFGAWLQRCLDPSPGQRYPDLRQARLALES